MPLSGIVGHRHVINLLRETVRRGRVPQSLLFAGPDGVGKRTTAIALAQAVNCPNRKDGDGCGVCPACQRIAGGRHSDVTIIDTAGEASIKIDAIRDQVLAAIGYRPFEAERRVFIIDSADEIRWEAQNALLKTLEEPPPSAMLVLVTAYPDTLLATVQSRCRRLRFGPLSEADVARVLAGPCGIDRTRAATLAATSGGSVTRALAEQDGELAEDRGAALGLLRAAGRGMDVLARLGAAKTLVEHESDRRDREALGVRLSVVESLLRDLGVLASGASVPIANTDLESELRALASSYDLRRVAAGFTAMSQAQQALGRNASPKIVADWAATNI